MLVGHCLKIYFIDKVLFNQWQQNTPKNHLYFLAKHHKIMHRSLWIQKGCLMLFDYSHTRIYGALWQSLYSYSHDDANFEQTLEISILYFIYILDSFTVNLRAFWTVSTLYKGNETTKQEPWILLDVY